MEKERFLAFTDAIIAIIATIMVLEFKTPDKSGWPALAIHYVIFPLHHGLGRKTCK